jgi:hypothetical protein
MFAQVLHINMNDKSETITGGFKVKVFKPVMKSNKFSIDYIVLSNSFYQINSKYNVLKLNFSSVDYTITITPGNYSSSELITAIKTKLLIIDAGFDITLGPNTQLITIVHATTAFTLTLSTSTINKILGFGTADLTGLATYTATNYFNNSWPFITMHSDAISSSLSSITSDNRPSFVETIVLDSPTGEYIYYKPQVERYYPVDLSGTTDTFDFYFIDPYKNKILDFTNGQFMIQMSFY